jgi:hypothetical protein
MGDEKDEFAKDEPEFQYIYAFDERGDADFHPVLVVHTKEEFMNSFVVLREEDNVGLEILTNRGDCLSIVLSCNSISFVYLVEPLGETLIGLLGGVLQGLQRLRTHVLQRDADSDTYSLNPPEESYVPGRDRVMISGWHVRTRFKTLKSAGGGGRHRWIDGLAEVVYDLLPVKEPNSYEKALEATQQVLSGEAPEPRDLVRRAWSARFAIASEMVRCVPRGPPPTPARGSVGEFLSRKAEEKPTEREREAAKRNNHDAAPVKLSKRDDEAIDALMLLFFPPQEQSETKPPEVKVEAQPEPVVPPEAPKPPEAKRRKILRVLLA